MSVLKTDTFPDFSKNLSKNRWADFMEILCLVSLDKEISLNDIISYYKQEDILNASDGDEWNSENSDKIRYDFLEIFQYIISRKGFFGEFYPFENIDQGTIKLSEIDKNKLVYIYFLLSSNTGYFIDKTIPPLFTTSFERVSLLFMNMLYPNFRNELFGTANQAGDYFNGGILLEKLKKLARCLNTSLLDKVIKDPHNNSPSGDRGIDIVSFYKLDIGPHDAPFIPACIGQCSCSYDQWDKKQYSIKYTTLSCRFNDLAIYHEYMFVPFPLRGIDGKWAKEYHADIQTIVIDRFRFFSILKLNMIEKVSKILTSNIILWLNNFLGDLNVKVN
jgi:hypothetical protein